MKIRKACPNDKKAVLYFCKRTFSWGDYISDVWDNWLSNGTLLVISDNKMPVAICHALIIKKTQIWIEGIRVNKNFRRKGFAKQLIKKAESIGKKNNCNVSKMLIQSNNLKSMNLAESLSYKKEEKWHFYSLSPKKIDLIKNVKFAKNEKSISELLSHISSYVKSWRWLPLTNSEIKSLIKEKRVIFSEHQNVINGLAICIDSEYFDKTIMVTLTYCNKKGNTKILKYIQNFSNQMGYKRIQILTMLDHLPKLTTLEKRFSFYLMKKHL